MAFITNFEISGLVGRKASYQQNLRRDVNVFFGLNGTGKTSLLKILHAAMGDETAGLRRVAFASAAVTVYSEDHKREFISTYTKPRPGPSEVETEEFYVGARGWVIGSEQVELFQRPQPGWSTTPERKDKATRWRHRYLPTSRLYAGTDISIVPSRHSRDITASEDELENVLAQFLDRIWASYSAQVLGSAKRIQDEGLRSILRSVLAKSPESVGGRIDPQAAYDRAVSFLGANAARVLGTPEDFRRRFREDPHMQNVMVYISRIQERVEDLTAPRTRLQQLVTDMYTGSKAVIFRDNAIEVRAEDKTSIPLASLSSGEKQLMRILLETLAAESNTIIIDEPEISMHVDWQRRLIQAMRQLNPHCQIIMATHSPEIMADLPDENIFRL